jgi:tetratricopeptide (TPR) repeat protein
MRKIFGRKNLDQDHYAQGVKLGLSRKYQPAISELSLALEEHSDSAEIHVSLGIALHKIGKDDRALASYESALKISPKYAEAHYFRANIHYPRNVPQGIAGYTRAIGLQPVLIEAHRQPLPQDRLTDYNDNPAQMYWLFKPAYRILKHDESLKAKPRQAEIYIERANAYCELWNYEQAIADYSAAIDIDSASALAYHQRGLAYEQVKQYNQAVADYTHAIELQPNYADAFVNLGAAYGKMGDMQHAVSSLTEAIRLNPDDLNGYYNRGSAFMRQGDYDRAISDFAHILQITPKDADAFYMRAKAHDGAGNRQRAIKDYENFIRLTDRAEARTEVQQRIAILRQGAG